VSISVATALVVAAALAWSVTGGLHDAPTLSATAIASRALSPLGAVVVVGAFGFAGPLVAGTAVADTIASFVALDGLSSWAALGTVATGLGAAMAWNLLTWRVGLPSSSTHGLVGGLVGATLVVAGPGDVRWGMAALADGELEGVAKILAALLLSPLVGLAAGAAVQRVAAWSLRSAGTGWNRRIRRAQVATVAGLAFAHGANEAQKSMGIIALALLVGGTADGLEVPAWAVVAAAATIPVAALASGWGIVRTLGYRIYPLQPLHAASAQIAAAAVVGASSALGGPVSTSQVTTSAIMGTGAAERPRSVRWETGKAILVTWLLTIPCTIALAALVAAIGRAVAAAA
jgi:PiT family inorganic phosphate transporter